MIDKYKTTVDQQQWKQILKQMHQQNIPLSFNKQKGGLIQLYANHIPKQLYIKHSYDKLKSSLNTFIEQFQQICHTALQNNNKKYKTIQQSTKIIRLQLQQITQELAFLNLKPISQIVFLLNGLIFRVQMNFINFVKMARKNHHINFQRKKQVKDSFKNYCIDCKSHRQQVIIKDLKRKLNLNKLQLNINNSLNQDNSFFTVQNKNQNKGNKQFLNDVVQNYNKIKNQIEENLNKQQKRQNLLHQNVNKVFQSKNVKYENDFKDDILMNEKENYLQQVNALLQGRQVHQTSNTHAYSYFINQLMQIPNLDKLNQQIYAKQAEIITQKIQKQLFQNFISTLSDPLKQIFKKILGKKYLQDQNDNKYYEEIKKVKKLNVQVQTSSISFEQKIKYLQKELQKKNFQISYIKSTKQQLQKKYFQKYQQQRQNQKQIHQKFVTMKQLQRKLQNILQQKQIVQQHLQKQKANKIQKIRNIQNEHKKALKDITSAHDRKYNEYRQRMNNQVQKKILKIKSEKDEQINYLKTIAQIKFGEKAKQMFTSLNAIIENNYEIKQNQLLGQNWQEISHNNSLIDATGKFSKSKSTKKIHQIELSLSKSNINVQAHTKTQKIIHAQTIKNISSSNKIQNHSISLKKVQSKQSKQQQPGFKKIKSSIENANNQKSNQMKNKGLKSYKKLKPHQISLTSLNNSNLPQSNKKAVFFKDFKEEISIKSIDLMIQSNRNHQNFIQSQKINNQMSTQSKKTNFEQNYNSLTKFQANNEKIHTKNLNIQTRNQNYQNQKVHQKELQNAVRKSVNKNSDKKSKKANFNSKKLISQYSQKQIFKDQCQRSITQSNLTYQKQNKQIFPIKNKNDQLNSTSQQLKKSIVKIIKMSKNPIQSPKSALKLNNLIWNPYQNQNSLELNQNSIQPIQQNNSYKNKDSLHVSKLNQSQKSQINNFRSSRNTARYNFNTIKQKTKPQTLNVTCFNVWNNKQSKKKIQKGQLSKRVVTLNSLNSFYDKNMCYPTIGMAQNQNYNRFNDSNQVEIQISRNQQTIQKVKQIMQHEYQYFKMIGIIDHVQNLDSKQINSLRKRILNVVKNITQQKYQNNSLSRSKDNFSKSHKTLKQIISKSMNKINQSTLTNKQKIEMQKLYNKYFDEIVQISSFSPLTVDDLNIFGGKQKAEQLQGIQMKLTQTSFMSINTLNQSQQTAILDYLKRLSRFKPQQYSLYVNFLRYPISTLNRYQQLIENEFVGKRIYFSKDVNYLKVIINKILNIHQNQHSKNCFHVQKFLKKIGFFRYSQYCSR